MARVNAIIPDSEKRQLKLVLALTDQTLTSWLRRKIREDFRNAQASLGLTDPDGPAEATQDREPDRPVD